MINWMSRFTGLVAAAALAGCTSPADEPVTLPPIPTASEAAPPTTAPATPDVPDVAPPVEPDNAHDYSAEGVESFTRYAIDVINYAYQTNDVSYLEQIMTPDCQTCTNTVARLTAIDEAGGRVEGGQIIPNQVFVVGPAEGVSTAASVDLTVTESRTVDGIGQVRDVQPARVVEFIFDLTREGEAWKLDEVR